MNLHRLSTGQAYRMLLSLQGVTPTKWAYIDHVMRASPDLLPRMTTIDKPLARFVDMER
jgi:hypothetical protein